MSTIRLISIAILVAFIGVTTTLIAVAEDQPAAAPSTEASKAPEAAPTTGESKSPEAAASPAPAASPSVEKKTFVCEACQVTKDAAGKCEKCGKDLVEKVQTPASPAPEASPAHEASPAPAGSGSDKKD